MGAMVSAVEPEPMRSTGQRPILQVAAGRRALSGFFLGGVLFSFLGAILRAWGYHVKSDHLTVGLYFLFLAFGIYAGAMICQALLRWTGLQALLMAGSGLACAAILALAYRSG